MASKLLAVCILFAVFVSLELKPILIVLEPFNSSNWYEQTQTELSETDYVNIVTDDVLDDILLQNIEKRLGVVSDFFDTFGEKAKETISSAGMCLSCKLAVSILRQYMKHGATENGIAKLSKRICSFLRIETPRVCQGLSELFKREMFVVLSKAVFTPGEICGIIFGKSCSSEINPLHNWTVPMTPFPKPPVEPIPPPKPGAPITRVLHLSDVHLDPYYMEGSLGNCKEPLCCRKDSGVPKHPNDAAGYWGDYRNCDTPLRTLENVLSHINKTHKFDYVIWTGDIPPHDIWSNSRKEVIALISQVSKLIDKYLGGVPIFPALGNHESSPVNSFPIPQIQGNDSISWLYNPLFDMWNKWVTSSNVESMRLGAYYSVSVQPGLKIISLNMNYCNNLNWWLLINSTDPADELSWLVHQLQISEVKGEKVHIIGHIPPGNSDCLKVWSDNYYEIIKRYESTVRGQFFGHTHSDEFAVLYDTDNPKERGRPFSSVYVGPSVTTFLGYNPGYRIYTVDGNYEGSTRLVLDHENYIMNLTKANANGNKPPEWFLEYSAAEAYGMPSLLPYDWDKLIQRFENDDQLFQKYYRYYVKQSDHFPDTCKGICKKKQICAMRRSRFGPDC